MRQAIFGVSLTAFVTVMSPSPAAADGGGESHVGNGGIVSNLWEGNTLEEVSGPHDSTVPSAPTEVSLNQQFCTGVNWTAGCVPPEQNTIVNWGEQALAFTPLPPSNLVVQPPNGRTLVNFETNFYTDAPEVLPFSVPILDQVVELRVWPAEFLWRFGDGSELRTTERGAAYPELGITDKYLQKGQVAPALDTTYAAEWRLQGTEQWLPVVGTVTIAGAPTTLEVVTATPMLVG